MTTQALLAMALPLAWALDALFGEPRNAWHPVAWLGRVLGPVGACLCRCESGVAFLGGGLAWMVFAVLLGWAAIAWQALCNSWPWWLGVPAMALALKPTFAWRMLHDEAAAVDAALAQSLSAARSRVARLVSRDVSRMDEALVRETALETLAENLNDSVVAPLFWYALLGLPGAAVYRFANTADAMWGYRGRFEWAGKWAARADDVLSWCPARLTGWLIYPARNMTMWRSLVEQASKTPSPNGGWPMGAMALRLQACLRKPEVYVLNEAAPSPNGMQFKQALGCAGRTAWTAMLVVTALGWWKAW